MLAVPSETGSIDIDATFLPTGHMRQVQRVTECTDTAITGEMHLDPDHWVFTEHFPGDPIFPGTLLIEAAGQLVALWAWAQGQRGRPRLLKCTAEFHRPLGPMDQTITLHGSVRRKRHISFGGIEIRGQAGCIATMQAVLAVLPDNGGIGR